MQEEKLYLDNKLETQQYKCPNCGGTSVFSPTEQKLKCEYCGTVFDIPNQTSVSEHELEELLKGAKNWTEAQVVKCASCGGKQIVNNNEISLICSFCGATNIVETNELPGITPHGVVPFKIERDNTINFIKKWAKNKFFAPSSFKNSIEPKNIHGVYAPVFTFDAKTQTSYSGSLYNTYTTTHTDSQGRTHTRTHKKNINDKFLYNLQPFPTNTAKTYNTQYLTGFSALTYSKDGKQCWQEGINVMENQIRRSILNGYSYDGINYYSQNTKILSSSYKFVLVPIYIGHYYFKEKTYYFYVNGHSGKVYGKTPLSPIKITLFVLFIITIIVLFAILFSVIGSKIE